MVETQEERKTDRQDEHAKTAGQTPPGAGLMAQLVENVQAVGEQLRSTVQQVGTQVRDTVQDLGGQAQTMGTKAQETFGEQYEHGRESLQELQQTVEARVRDNPLQSLLVAGALGMLLALLWRRS
ncbi:MAG: hypothetical protein AB7N91_18265 [Candidatus Tectimicrobiota bacterium]